MVLYGPPGSCKTFVALDAAFSIATGQPFLGVHQTKQGGVVYLYSEGQRSCQRRYEAWLSERGIDELPDDSILLPYSYDLIESCDVGEIIEVIEEEDVHPTLIVIDTLAKNTTGDENSTKDMTRFIAAIESFRDRWDCSVLVVHHTGRNPKLGERGSSALRGGVDSMFSATAVGEDRIKITHDKAKDDLLLPAYEVGKRLVGLGMDEEGEPRTSLVLVNEGRTSVSCQQTALSRDGQIVDVILEIVAAEPAINTTNLQRRVREQWTKCHATGQPPGTRKIVECLKSLEGTKLAVAKGEKNSSLWTVLQ